MCVIYLYISKDNKHLDKLIYFVAIKNYRTQKRWVDIISILLVMCSSLTRTLSQAWPILQHYDQDHLYNIALPLGGIGTGTVSLGGRGELRDWEIANKPAKKYSTVTIGNDAPFFAIFVNQSSTSTKMTKALIGPVHPTEHLHYEGRACNNHGLPRFEQASFDAAYPFGIVNLSDQRMPVRIDMKLSSCFPME